MKFPEGLKNEIRFGAVIFVFGVLGLLFINTFIANHPPKRSGYYAVFLDSNQVYFGNIEKENEQAVTLTSIYYLQTKPGADASAQADASLLKLGNEVHGPEDRMEINRAHVLFVEKLRDDGKVVQAIKNFKK